MKDKIVKLLLSYTETKQIDDNRLIEVIPNGSIEQIATEIEQLVKNSCLDGFSNNESKPKRYCKGCIKDVTETMWCECGEQSLNQNSTYSEKEAFEM